MLIEYKPDFLKTIKKIKDATFKEKVKKKVEKIIENPEIGKPMRYNRKGTRELYVEPYRLAYAFIPEEGKIIFLGIYHKDEQ
ncbi:MAG: type II toxin-antitoxin system RelE/ParE family toxin [Candidatus Nanoarchaeia archaeon]